MNGLFGLKEANRKWLVVLVRGQGNQVESLKQSRQLPAEDSVGLVRTENVFLKLEKLITHREKILPLEHGPGKVS